MNKKRALELFLWVLSIFFASQIYSSINGPIKFNQVKNEKSPLVGKVFAMKVIDKKTILK